MRPKSVTVQRKHKAKNWEDPKIVTGHPETLPQIREFIDKTEGKENKGGDPRLEKPIKFTMSDKAYQRQQAAMKRLKAKGFFDNK